VRELVAHRGAGNVTVPHKVRFAESCDSLTSVARRTGAVNTFWTEEGSLVGDNTDVAGFTALAASLLGTSIRGRRIALIGAGGAAAAVLAAVEEWKGVTVTVTSRTRERSEALRCRFPGFVNVAMDVASAVAGADVIVNATPLGLSPSDPPVVDVEMLPRGAVIIDLTYAAGGTSFVRDALARGHEAADGTLMLVEQGAESFRRWFGIEADRNAMWEALGNDGRTDASRA